MMAQLEAAEHHCRKWAVLLEEFRDRPDIHSPGVTIIAQREREAQRLRESIQFNLECKYGCSPVCPPRSRNHDNYLTMYESRHGIRRGEEWMAGVDGS